MITKGTNNYWKIFMGPKKGWEYIFFDSTSTNSVALSFARAMSVSQAAGKGHNFDGTGRVSVWSTQRGLESIPRISDGPLLEPVY